jgi:hypothetical protein
MHDLRLIFVRVATFGQLNELRFLLQEDVAANARIKIVVTMSFRTCISQLLNHRAVRSQQLRITPNKFRPFKALRICRLRLDLLSTGQITMVSQAATLCYSHEGEEERKIEFDSLSILSVKIPFDHKTVYAVHRR